jgi:hypothetical protein
VLEQRAHFRVVVPARPQAPGSLRVEACDARGPAFAATPAAMLAEAMSLAQKCAGEIARAGGASRVVIEASAQPLRIEVVRIA